MEKGLLINLGSGQCRFDSPWINIDRVNRGGIAIPDVCADGEFLPLPSDSTIYIVLQHCLEHFGCGEARAMLKECYRVLKVGGSLVVTVPDMRKLAIMYLTGREMDAQLYMTNVYGAYLGHPEDRHKWGYDTGSLKVELEAAAPWIVRSWNWNTLVGAKIARDDRWILGAEAVKQ